MAIATPLAGMVAVGQHSGAPPVGFLTVFSVPDRPVSLNTLKLRWLIAGLDPGRLPRDPRALYLFKRAMRAEEGKITLPNGSVIETDVRDVAEDGDFCVYQISRVVKDVEDQVVEYPKSLRVIYNKEADEVSFTPLEDADVSETKPMQDSIMAYLSDNAKMIDGRKVRALVRNFIKDSSDPTDRDAEGNVRVTGLGGESLRGKGGGVYFVKAAYESELNALSEALDGLYPDHAAELWTVPMIDDANTRELIRKKHVANAKAEIDEAIQDVAELLREDRKNAVRSDVKDYWFKKLRMLQERSAEYESILKEEQGDVKDALEMARLQMEKLV